MKITLLVATVGLMIVAARAARADVPGPRSRCVVDNLGCEECRELYAGDVEHNAEFLACKKAAEEKGLVEACRSDRQGIATPVFFCPKGVRPETKVVGGGCAGCALASTTGMTSSLVFAACAAAAFFARRRRPGR